MYKPIHALDPLYGRWTGQFISQASGVYILQLRLVVIVVVMLRAF